MTTRGCPASTEVVSAAWVKPAQSYLRLATRYTIWACRMVSKLDVAGKEYKPP